MINLSFFKKDNSYIHNNIHSLGLYECDSEKILEFWTHKNSYFEFYYDLRFFEDYQMDKSLQSDCEIFIHRYEILFYDLLNNIYPFKSKNGNYITFLFDSSFLLKMLNRIEPNIEFLFSDMKDKYGYEESIVNSDKENLNNLISFLNENNDELLIKFSADV